MAETEIVIRPQKEMPSVVQSVPYAVHKQEQYPEQVGEIMLGQEKAVIVPSEIAEEDLQNSQGKTLLTQNAIEQLASPADYVFHFSPETVVDETLIEDFRNFAFEQKMSLENARLMARFYENYVQTQSKKQRQEQMELLKSMQKACEEDSEYGGLNFQSNMRYAKAAILRFDDGSLAKILNETGFGSHPEVVRFMYRVGRVLAEKDMPQAKEVVSERSAAELFYPSMKK